MNGIAPSHRRELHFIALKKNERVDRRSELAIRKKKNKNLTMTIQKKKVVMWFWCTLTTVKLSDSYPYRAAALMTITRSCRIIDFPPGSIHYIEMVASVNNAISILESSSVMFGDLPTQCFSSWTEAVRI